MSTMRERMLAKKGINDKGEPITGKVPPQKVTPRPVTRKPEAAKDNDSMFAKPHGTTGKPSLKTETPQTEPEKAEVKQTVKSEAVKPEPRKESSQPTQTAQKPRPRVGGSLIQAAMNKQKKASTEETAGSVAERAKAAAKAATEPKPVAQETAPVASQSAIKPRTTVRANPAAEMLKGDAIMEFSEKQIADFDAVEGLNVDMFMQNLETLETYLTDEVPDIASLQQYTHTNLRQYPELTHILSDKQVGVVVQGLAKRRNIEIVAPSNGNKGKTNVKNLTRNMSESQLLDSL